MIHRKAQISKIKPKCGLCGSSKKALIKTPCCNNWICDDEDTYVIFSYARNSCYRHHDRYTLCSSHFHEGHDGKWQDMGTNEHNFEVLENPEKVTVDLQQILLLLLQSKGITLSKRKMSKSRI